MTNFFGWIEISFVFQEDTTFEDVLAAVKEQFCTGTYAGKDRHAYELVMYGSKNMFWYGW